MNKILFSVIVLLLLPTLSYTEQIVEVKDDYNNGISSGIFYNDTDEHIGDTNQSGIFVSESLCTDDKMIIAKPKSPLYESGKCKCVAGTNKFVVKVTWKPIYSNLIENKNYFISRGDYASAALASNEIVARSTDVETVKAERIEIIVNFSKYLKLSEATKAVNFDPVQKETVATPAMVDAVKLFQKNNGLPETGLIDYKTLSEAADRDVGSIMFQSIQ